MHSHSSLHLRSLVLYCANCSRADPERTVGYSLAGLLEHENCSFRVGFPSVLTLCLRTSNKIPKCSQSSTYKHNSEGNDTSEKQKVTVSFRIKCVVCPLLLFFCYKIIHFTPIWLYHTVCLQCCDVNIPHLDIL